MNTETSTEIIRATGRALCEHGYANLTMQRIAEESSMTTAAIHYHFDTKDELLNALLDDVVDGFEERLACDGGDPRERIGAFLDAVFAPSTDRSDEFPVAVMELKSQAPYHEAYRERFIELDEVMRTVVATIVREGMADGHFDDADPDEVARTVSTMVNGGHVRKVALGEDGEETRRVVERYLEQRLAWTPEMVA
ncbi:TetR/AcrR family transcriptional regulator [Haladaptatus sp. CMAA 1911]|uniref:TetR/AcrR family transcriptional regulator n=1 Tax=unclassified Haladaptatus TaxID=2622732 RepID=UPI0037542516